MILHFTHTGESPEIESGHQLQVIPIITALVAGALIGGVTSIHLKKDVDPSEKYAGEFIKVFDKELEDQLKIRCINTEGVWYNVKTNTYTCVIEGKRYQVHLPIIGKIKGSTITKIPF